VNGDEAQKTSAVENTLYVVAQYFGWSEILRREIQFLSFSDSKQSRAVANCSAGSSSFFSRTIRSSAGRF
jgi:hypothetical protein